MFKLFVFAAFMAVAFAAPQPKAGVLAAAYSSPVVAAPLAYTAGVAPVAYSAGYAAAPLAYSAGYVGGYPSAYSAYTGYPSAYSAYTGYPAYSAYSAPVVLG